MYPAILSTLTFAIVLIVPPTSAQSASEIKNSDWTEIRNLYENGRNTVYSVENGLRSRNRSQQWNTHYDGRGFVITPDNGIWTWGLELQQVGWGATRGTVSPETDIKTTIQHELNVEAIPLYIATSGHDVEYHWSDLLTEWYKNKQGGLEHGYTVRRRPASADGPLEIVLGVRGNLSANVQESGVDVKFKDSRGNEILQYSGLTVVDADGKRVSSRFESTNTELRIVINDVGAHYPITVDPMIQELYLKASNTGPGDMFGWSLAASGDTVVVGARGEPSTATGVNGDQTINSPNGSYGAAYVFVKNLGVWSQQAYLKASNTDLNDEFGFSVAISGDTIVVGAYSEDSNSTGVNGDQNNNAAPGAGAAYVYVRNGTTWTQQAYLKASNTDPDDNFGWSVAVSGDTIVVGARGEDSNSTGVNGNQLNNSAVFAGAAYVFERTGSTWAQQAYLKASNTEMNDFYGWSVAVSGDTVVVGAADESSNSTGVNGDPFNNGAPYSGAVYVYVRNGSTWSQQAYLKSFNTDHFQEFGHAVSISGDTLVVGAEGEASGASGVNGNGSDTSMPFAGAAYVFVRNGNTWSQEAYLKSSNPDSNDQFGWSVSVSGDTVVVGAIAESGNSTGLNGDASDNSLVNAGAAYLFVRSGNAWSQQYYIKASNTGSMDQFGRSVALSGSLVIVGAPLEMSNATGLNGDQSNNSYTYAGAAYLYDLGYTPGTGIYGTGTPGCSGTQTMSVTHAPMLNSPHFAMVCSNAPPLSLGLGLVSDSQDLTGSDPFGLGVLLHSDFLFATEILSFDFYSDATGYSETVGAIIPNDIALIGKTFYACALWAWPRSICVLPGFNPYNLSTSRGLALTILAP